MKNDVATLSRRDACRLELYRAMNLAEMGRNSEARDLVARVIKEAESKSYVDESLVMHAIMARSLVMEGDARKSLVAAARGLRRALADGLYLRANSLYRISSTAYEELGDSARSRHCQEKAIQLADTLGLREMSGVSWTRLGTAQRKAGRYGNAIRNLDRAVFILGEQGPAWSRVQALVGLYGVLVLVQSERKNSLKLQIDEQLTGSGEHNALGYYYCWQGRDLEHHGKHASAEKLFERGAEHFRLGGYLSNVAWAMSHHARVKLKLGHFKQASTLLDQIQADLATSSSSEAAFELAVLRLKESFLSRSPWHLIAKRVTACEAGLKDWQTATSRVDALQALLRAYARRSMVTEANDVMMRYRELVLEISSNLDVSDAPRAIELSDAGEIVGEFVLLRRRS